MNMGISYMEGRLTIRNKKTGEEMVLTGKTFRVPTKTLPNNDDFEVCELNIVYG